MAVMWTLLLLIVLQVQSCVATVCYYSSFDVSLGYYSSGSMQCESCCGYYYDRSCCTSIGLITGIVISVVILIGVMIAVSVYCVIKNKHQKKINNRAAENNMDVLFLNGGNVNFGFEAPPPPYSADNFHPAPNLQTLRNNQGKETNPSAKKDPTPVG